jgi:hypothetical protein
MTIRGCVQTKPWQAENSTFLSKWYWCQGPAVNYNKTCLLVVCSVLRDNWSFDGVNGVVEDKTLGVARSNPVQETDVCVSPSQQHFPELGPRISMKMNHGSQTQQSNTGSEQTYY